MSTYIINKKEQIRYKFKSNIAYNRISAAARFHLKKYGNPM